tara:strand:+ start:283 stop:522 length:240 start_codon:yes stop_codon:yes gene_type:complete
MNSYKTELYQISFGIDEHRCTPRWNLTEVTITKLSSDEYEDFTNLPLFAGRLCDLIEQGKMSQKEASKTIAKAMIHLTS